MISYGIKCTYSVVNAMLRTILSARDASGVRPVPDAGSPDFPLSVSLLSLDTRLVSTHSSRQREDPCSLSALTFLV